MRLSRRSGASDGITTDFAPPSKRVHKEPPNIMLLAADALRY